MLKLHELMPMSAKRYAVFFLILFSLFLTVPSVINLMERTDAISCFLGVAEETSETAEHTLLLTPHPEHYDPLYHLLTYTSDTHYRTPDRYHEIILDKNCPPPEQLL
ncbi:MAG: hypothetical protein KDD04_08145 [Sinomicrobium sp.]|nr:hypothetical protein [Sinomicrobium sp.]